LFPHSAHALTAITTDNYTLYSYVSSCTGVDQVFPGKDKMVGIVVPSSTPHIDTTYIYFHGNDELPIGDICNGLDYQVCDAAVVLGAPMIIPRTAVKGSSKKTRISKSDFNCVLNEANDIMSGEGITLATDYIVAGHSGGAFTMSSYFLAGLTAQRAIVLDGCYVTDPPNPNPPANFCQDIIANFAGPVDFYYQTLSGSGETAGTQVESLKAAATTHAGTLTAKKVNLTHYQLATACLKDLATCGDKVVDDKDAGGSGTSGGGTSGGTSGGTTAPKGPTYTGNELPIHTVNLVNPINGNVTDLRIILGNVLKKLMAIIGAVTLVVFIIGGAYWLLSAGNPERVKKGTETMVWAAIGLFVVFGAYGILSAVIGGLTGRAVVDRSAPTDSSDTQLITEYVKIIDKETLIWSEPKTNVISRGTLNPKTDCVPVTGKKQNGYTEVRDPNNLALYGWVLDGSILKTTSKCGSNAQSTSEDAPAWCLTTEGVCVEGGGGPCSGRLFSSESVCLQNRTSYSCVCTATDQNNNTTQATIPGVDTPSACVANISREPGITLSNCTWQKI